MTKKKKDIRVLGLMSGTSLDGLDMALCSFSPSVQKSYYQYEILATKTLAYQEDLKSMLRDAYLDTEADLMKKHLKYGEWLGQQIQQFLKNNHCDYIASHGHTIFHRPELGYSFQLGEGQTIADTVQIPVIADFRNTDIALGGQGAPLVPVGDLYLFNEYKYCINIGGICNISVKSSEKNHPTLRSDIIAYDIGVANMLLNDLAGKIGLEYDYNGEKAAKGSLILDLYDQLNALEYYKAPFPKSLGVEWYEQHMKPLFTNHPAAVEDQLHTAVKHIALQIYKALANDLENGDKILISGGGAYNKFLIECMAKHLQKKVVIQGSNKELVEFKEALIFAFMGYLKVNQKVNCFKSVTGARADSSCGTLFAPNP